jgi:hypothetical protein
MCKNELQYFDASVFIVSSTNIILHLMNFHNFTPWHEEDSTPISSVAATK